MLLGIDFSVLALFVGAVSESRSIALGVSSAITTASCLVGSLAPGTHWVHPLRFVSLFFWAVGDGHLRIGLSVTSALVLLAFAAVGFGAAVTAFERQDVH